MREQAPSINKLRIASPCPVGWESMAGDERVRFCSLCELHVYNISEMTAAQARELVTNTEGRICARLFRRADGTVITRDCPVGLSALRRRVTRVAGAALAAIFSACCVTFGQKKEQSCARVPELRITKVAPADKQETLAGIISDEVGALIPGVNVTLKEERTKRKLTTSTNGEGEFNFNSLPAGRYTVEARAAGFKTFKLKGVQINSGEQARVELILKADGETVTVGIMVDSPMIESGNGTTIIRGEMIRKLPIPE